MRLDIEEQIKRRGTSAGKQALLTASVTQGNTITIEHTHNTKEKSSEGEREEIGKKSCEGLRGEWKGDL